MERKKKEFWRDSIMEKINTGGENENCEVGEEMLEKRNVKICGKKKVARIREPLENLD